MGVGAIDPSVYPGSDGPAFHLEVTMGHRLRKSFVRNAFIPDLEVNNKSKGYGVSQRLKNPKAGIVVPDFRTNLTDWKNILCLLDQNTPDHFKMFDPKKYSVKSFEVSCFQNCSDLV